MTKRLEELTLRKQSLIDRCARERADLAAAWGKIRSPLAVGVTLLGVGRSLRRHPVIAAGLSSLLVSGYGAKLFRQAREMFQLWRLVQPIRMWWRKFRAPR